MIVPKHARGYEKFEGLIGKTTASAEPAWPSDPTPPDNAPNIIVIVADDLGFSDIAPYGSEIPTPNLQRVADRGITMTNYHTAPMCSPAHASLLTGVNPHRAGFGFVSNVDPGFPGMRIEFGDEITTLPRILRDQGYATMAFGKWHLAREANMHEGASKASWPCQQGFDHYYGSLEGLNSFFEPNQLVADNTILNTEKWPDDYYLTDDLTDRAVSQILSLRSANPHKPFFMYFAHVAVHAPLQAPADLLEEQRGKYAAGWDSLREARFRRQREKGLFGPTVEQAPPNNSSGYDVSPWDELTSEEQTRYAKYMEAYAAMVVTIDRSVGRLMKVLEDLGELDNTLIVFTSDNGASAEGGAEGTRSYYRMFPHTLAEFEWQGDTPIDEKLIGGPDSAAHYPRGWAQASNTPFRYYKGQTFAGGVRVPFLASWPDASKKMLGVREQYSYVTDLVPTILDLVGIEHPGTSMNAELLAPDGNAVSCVWTDPNAESPHQFQYSEIAGHRGMYYKGWKLLSLYDKKGPVDEPEWQLFDMRNDPTELQNVASEHPEIVRQLSELWDYEGWQNTVFPLVEASGPGARALPGRRPADKYLTEPVRILPGTPVLERYRSVELIQFRDFRVRVLFGGSRASDEGVLVSHGDSTGGYILFVEDGELCFGYNCYGEPSVVRVASWDDGIRSLTLSAKVVDPLKWTFTVNIDEGPTIIALDEVPQMTGMAPWTGIAVGRDPRGPVLRSLRNRKGIYPWTGLLREVIYEPGKQRTIESLRELVQAEAHRRAD